MPVNLPEDAKRAIQMTCSSRLHMWLDDSGMDGDVSRFERHNGVSMDLGAECVITVGKGTDPDTAVAQWTWSSRYQHWRAYFASVALAQRSREMDARIAALLDVD